MAMLETFYIQFWARIRPGWKQGWPGSLPDGCIPPCSRWYSKNITRSQAEQLLKQEVSVDSHVTSAGCCQLISSRGQP